MIHIIVNILYIICVFFAFAWGILIRDKAKAEQAIEGMFGVFGLLMVVSLILIPILSLSPFHLLWMFLVSFLLGLLSLIFPFNLLLPLGSFYSSLWCIGLKSGKFVKKN